MSATLSLSSLLSPPLSILDLHPPSLSLSLSLSHSLSNAHTHYYPFVYYLSPSPSLFLSLSLINNVFVFWLLGDERVEAASPHPGAGGAESDSIQELFG